MNPAECAGFQGSCCCCCCRGRGGTLQPLPSAASALSGNTLSKKRFLHRSHIHRSHMRQRNKTFFRCIICIDLLSQTLSLAALTHAIPSRLLRSSTPATSRYSGVTTPHSGNPVAQHSTRDDDDGGVYSIRGVNHLFWGPRPASSLRIKPPSTVRSITTITVL